MPSKGKTQGIPAPVGVQDTAVERILWAVREKLEGRDDATNKTVSNLSGRLGAIEDAVGEDLNPVRPVRVTNLQTQGIFGAIILTADAIPAGAGYIEWLAADTDDLGVAQVVGTSIVPIWRHTVGDGIGRYYWARGVGRGKNPLRGPINQTAGTFGRSGTDPAYLKEVLDGQIERDQLSSDLLAPIENAGVAYRAVSGKFQGPTRGGLYEGNGAQIRDNRRSWRIHKFDADGNFKASRRFDTYGTVTHSSGTAAANALADYVNQGDYTAIAATTYDAPGYNITDAMKDALVSVGANRAVLDAINNRDTYILIGHRDAGAGNGTEKASDITISQTFSLIGGYPSTSGHGALVDVQQGITDKLGAQYTVKAQAVGDGVVKVAGIGLASGPLGDSGVVSRVYVSADRFAVLDPADSSGGSATYPFTVANGNIYANTAIFKNASITDAMIKNLGANKVVADSLAALSARMGTVTGGTFRTAGSGVRAEMSSSGGYPIWVGSGSKTASNADLYLDSSGLHAKGDITARRLEAGTADIIDTLMLRGNAVTFPLFIESENTQSYTGGDSWESIMSMSVSANDIGPNGAFIELRTAVTVINQFNATASQMQILLDGSQVAFYFIPVRASSDSGTVLYAANGSMGGVYPFYVSPGSHYITMRIRLADDGGYGNTTTRTHSQRRMRLLALKDRN